MTVHSTFKVIVAGGREFKQRTHSIVIVSGTARGADTLGERYAQERGYSIEQYPADWEHAGKAAGFIRNAQMASVADALIAFWDGQSRGTAHMIELARKHELQVRVVPFNR